MMRDNIKLYQNFSSFFYNCPFCSKNAHFLKNCSKLHYIPNKSFLISKFNFSEPHKNSKVIIQRKQKRYNFRRYLTKIQRCSFNIQKDLDEEENMVMGTYEEINFDLPKISSKEENEEEEKTIIPKIPMDFEKHSDKFFFVRKIFYYFFFFFYNSPSKKPGFLEIFSFKFFFYHLNFFFSE